MNVLARTDAHEGPVYVADENALYFTTSRPRVDIRRLDLATGEVTTLRADANMANGMTLGPSGDLIVCEQGTLDQAAAITRVARADGSARVVVDSWQGAPLNSPNDVVVSRDGALWFTDPSYGHLQGFRPPPGLADCVYRFDPRSRRLACVADDFDKPNGLAFSPDESILYVGDSARCHVKAYDVVGRRALAGERIFCEIDDGYPDGLKVDSGGRVYTTAAGGVRIFTRHGALLDELPVPGAVNFAFAGDRLLITADDAIWSASISERSSRWISSVHAG